MTELEIIQAWKYNEYMAFGGMPPECQEWARKHCEENIWFAEAYNAWLENINCNKYVVYRLGLDYQPTPKPVDSDWVEIDIVDEAYRVNMNHGFIYRHWQHTALLADRVDRTLPDGRILTKFGGWYWPRGDRACWSSVPQIDTNGVPVKIRFWAERIEL